MKKIIFVLLIMTVLLINACENVEMEDSLISKCKESFNECKDNSDKKMIPSMSILAIEKFTDKEKAEKFFDKWNNIPDIFNSNRRGEPPYVLIAVEVFVPNFGPRQAIILCDEKGELPLVEKGQLECN